MLGIRSRRKSSDGAIGAIATYGGVKKKASFDPSENWLFLY
jgi:hypothetical protein